MKAPPIDRRTYDEIVAETEALVQAYTAWRPNLNQPDAGSALVRIFGRFVELAIERLNRVPEKNFLAFLNLIGIAMLPPQPARVPLTFRLAAKSPIEAAVPATTQVAALPLEGQEDEVIFETERDLVVTRARLQSVWVRDTETDRYRDCSPQALGHQDKSFTVFRGDTPIPHILYLACDELLAQAGRKDVTLKIHSPDRWQWQSWPIHWSHWDAEAKRWQSIEPEGLVINDSGFAVTLRRLPQLTPHRVEGVEAGWLQARLNLPLPPGQTSIEPESVASGNDNPADLSAAFYPFGETAAVKRFYLSADQAFAVGGAIVRLHIRFRTAARGANVRLRWLYKKTENGQWVELGLSAPGPQRVGTSSFGFSDGTQALTRDGAVTFRVPLDWRRTLHRSRSGRWLRVDIDQGQYSTLPQMASLSVSYEWELPRISRITAMLETDPQPLRPETAFLNSGTIDLSKDFYPFGEQPRYNDALYVALPETLVRPQASVKLMLRLTNPLDAERSPVPRVTTDGKPLTAWEVWDGRGWLELGRYDSPNTAGARPETFTQSGLVSLILPETLAPVAVNGEQRYWLRVRLVGGHYGEPASYVENTVTVAGAEMPIYTPKAATYAPPVIASLRFESPMAVHRAREVPLSACLSNNDFTTVHHTATATAPEGEFLPFTVTEDRCPTLYLGLDRAFDPRPMTLYLSVQPPRPEQVAAERLAEIGLDSLAQISWEYASPQGWRPLGALDETQTLARRGLVHFIGPQDFSAREVFGHSAYWLRARWHRGQFALPPRLRRVLLNTIWATQATIVRDENLGSSTGNAAQGFHTAQTPVQPGQHVEVREAEMPTAAERETLQRLEGPQAIQITLDVAGQTDEIWVRWLAVSDFYHSGPRDRHYTIDALSGEIRFGDGHSGRIPPAGQNNIRVTYRTGGGAQGNRAAGSIVQLKSSVPYIDGVTNHEPALGGAQCESLDQVKQRGPRVLRHRDRAVTAQDLEDLAQEADPQVARVRAIVPVFHPYNLWLDPEATTAKMVAHETVDAGRAGVIVVPNSDAVRPTPSISLLRRVKVYLQTRCAATAGLWVAGPQWVRLSVEATVIPASLATADTLTGRIVTVLNRFLHPLTGGLAAQGWAFGRLPHRSDLYALLEGIDGVDHVRVLTVRHAPQSTDESRRIKLRDRLDQSPTEAGSKPAEPQVQRWLDRSLVYSGQHDIRLVLERP